LHNLRWRFIGSKHPVPKGCADSVVTRIVGMMHHMPLARSVQWIGAKVNIVLKPFLQKGRIKIKANAQPPLFSYENKYGSGYDFSDPKINGTAPVVIEQEYI